MGRKNTFHPRAFEMFDFFHRSKAIRDIGLLLTDLTVQLIPIPKFLLSTGGQMELFG